MLTKKTRVATKPSRIKISVFVDPLTAQSLRDHRLAQGRLIDEAVKHYLELELKKMNTEQKNALKAWLQGQLDALNESTEQKQSQQWEPKGGEWFIGSNGGAFNDNTSPDYRKFGLERDSEEYAKKAAEEMRVMHRLLAYRDEFDSVYVFTPGSENAYVAKNHLTGNYVARSNEQYQIIGGVYMSANTAIELARKLNAGEVVL